MASAPYELVLDRHTVLTQSVSTPSTSSGADRHAQSLVTSSHPLGSASPIGIRQFQTQGTLDARARTAGTAVMVYSGDVDVEAAMDAFELPLTPDVLMGPCARATATRRDRT